LRLIDQVFAYFAHNVGKFLHVVLDEVDLAHVVLLDAIEAVAVLVLNLVYSLVHHLDMPAVLVTSLARRQLRMINLLLQSR